MHYDATKYDVLVKTQREVKKLYFRTSSTTP